MASRERGRGFIRSLLGTGVIAVLLIAAVSVGFRLLGSPFSTTEKDRSAPPILLELKSLSEYHAAQARLEVLIDIEKDVKWMPSFIAGERVQFIGVGTVDATVNFEGLDQRRISVDPDGKTVSISLPHATMMEPVLDRKQSHVTNRDRGVLNRVGGIFSDSPTSEQSLYNKASEKLADAAAHTDLLQRAEENTKAMLVTMLRSMGFNQVHIVFEDQPATTTDSSTPSTVPPWRAP